MSSSEILYGYELVFEISDINIFEFIGKNTDNLFWEEGFRPVFSEEKYIKSFEGGKMELVPISKFEVTIVPQEKASGEARLEQIKEQIKNIANSIAQGRSYSIIEDKKFVLIFHQKIVLDTLLPRWYIPVVRDSETTLQEFRTFVEDKKDDRIRQTEVTLSKKEKDVIEIRVISKDLELAESLIESIRGSSREE